MEEEVKFPDGYCEVSSLPSTFVEEYELETDVIIVKKSYLEQLRNGEFGNLLDSMGFDRYFIEENFLVSFAQDPLQIREMGGGALLLADMYGGYWTDSSSFHEPRCFAMRIVPVEIEGGRFWEFVDFDLHYNLKRKDRVLWKREESK